MTPLRSLMRRPQFVCALVATAAAFAVAWTAGGCDTGVDTQTVRLDSAFDRTGSLRSDGAFTPITAIAAMGVIAIGDMETDGVVSNLAIRGFVSISLAALPPNANVTKVVLRLQGNAPLGNPFADFGNLVVDHVNVVSGINKDSFFGGLIAPSIATAPTLTADKNAQSFELDVTTHVKGDIAAGRPISSFRLQFAAAPSADLQADQVWLIAPTADGFEDARPNAIATIQP